MKKVLLVIVSLLLLAAACQKTTPAPATNNQPANNQPAGSLPQRSVYDNEPYQIHLDYTGLPVQNEAPTSYIPAQNDLSSDIANTFSLYLNPSFASGTNLESAWFNLAIDPNRGQTSCYTSSADTRLKDFDKIRKVQNNNWHYATPNPLGDAAAGHQSLRETYRLYKNSVCYEVVLGTSDFNRQNLENPDSVKEYNAEQIFGVLGSVFNNLEVQNKWKLSF